MRKYLDIVPEEPERFKTQLCLASQDYGVSVILDSNDFDVPEFTPTSQKYAFIAGLGSVNQVLDDLSQVKLFHNQYKDWMLGYLSYDVKNQIETSTSNLPDKIGLPELFFFTPRYLFINDTKGWKVGYVEGLDDEASVLELIEEIKEGEEIEEEQEEVHLNHQVSHKDYLQAIDKILWHIQRGDIYELNYCMEFFVQDLLISPQFVYERLKQISPTPFGAYLKYHDKFLMCASPERYLKKQGQHIFSQPIKGTSSRNDNEYIDQQNKDYLLNSPKERAENIMITDLVRNDLSKVAARGSVHVDELCGIYSFKQVHQMISTVSAQLREGVHWLDAIRATFPMGSMTGAPKTSAIKLIENYEKSKRGLYSGCIGYVTPEGDFDFNVVIRSVLYNRKRSYLSFNVGGAITGQSIPQQEYEECLLKASAIMKVFKIEN